MSKFSPNTRSYFQTGVSGYIGSGNKVGTFTRRSKPAFSKLKQIYGDHLEDLGPEHLVSVKRPKLSPQLREQIRASVKREYKKHRRKQILAIAISIILLLAFLFAIWRIVIHFYPNLR